MKQWLKFCASSGRAKISSKNPEFHGVLGRSHAERGPRVFFRYIPAMTASVSNWVGLASLVLLAACGGRTSTLMDENDPSLGSSVPNGNAGGAAGSPAPTPPGPGPGVVTGTGGSSSVPAGPGTGTAGSPATGGATGSGGSPAILPACTDFCDRVKKSPCSGELGDAAGSCTADCTGSLGVDVCAPLAKAAIDCYLPIFSASAGHCSSIGDQAQRKCGRQVQAYIDCASANQPQPPPAPSCSGSGSASTTSCNLTQTCSDGSFSTVSCRQTGADQAECTCISATGLNAQFTLNEKASYACNDAAISCGAPYPGGYDGGGPPK